MNRLVGKCLPNTTVRPRQGPVDREHFPQRGHCAAGWIRAVAPQVHAKGNSRDQELEADREGPRLAIAAGFDPCAAARGAVLQSEPQPNRRYAYQTLYRQWPRDFRLADLDVQART